MLEFKDVFFRYKEDPINTIDNLSFSVDRGEFVSIIGASGCGKSTIFRLINGLENSYDGEILINDKNIKTLKNYSGYMPQKDLLYPWRTIEKNVSIPLEINRVDKSEINILSNEILSEVGLLDYKDKYPKELSGGMRQRVSFARTLLTGSELLLLDEPFSALDSLTKMGLQEWLLNQWEKNKKTILFVTHDVEEAIFLSKRVLVIDDYPVSSFKEYEVPLAYPRKREDLKAKEIVDLKEVIISEIRQKVTK